MDYSFLLVIALILLSTKVLGLASERVHMPQVVGALLAGLILGPSVLNWVTETDFLMKASELGVIILMFTAFHGVFTKTSPVLWVKNGEYFTNKGLPTCKAWSIINHVFKCAHTSVFNR